MNILITGLTLHNNKGGPSLALSLIRLVKKKFKNAKFFLAVPDFNNNILFEKEWAKKYEIIDDVIATIGIKEFLPPFSFFSSYRERRKSFLKFLNKIDLLIDLTPLSYMDLPFLSLKKNLAHNLSIYTIRLCANRKKIKMIRWTQSYGPFSNFVTKFLVKRDLASQKYIFTRGKESYNFVKNLLPTKKIFSFPDVAIILPWKTNYVEKLGLKKFITISPSSVLYTIQKKQHINEMVNLIEHLQWYYSDYSILLVPYNMMRNNPTLKNCDLTVSREINRYLSKKVEIIEDDLDVYNLKGIIAKSSIHIGARYHSIVAALSSNVPSISLAWHNKYRELMEMYKMEEFVYEIFSRNHNIEKVYTMVEKIFRNYNEIKQNLKESQKKLEKEIEKNLNLFIEMLNEM